MNRIRRAALLLIAIGTHMNAARAAGWADDFERAAIDGGHWDSVDAVRIEPAAGWDGAAALTGSADDRYGAVCRSADANGPVELSARIRIAGTGAKAGAVLALRAKPPAVGSDYERSAATNAAVGLELIREENDGVPCIWLQLVYGHPVCGQRVPSRSSRPAVTGKLAADTWYDVKLRAWPDDGAWLARAWYKPCSTEDWAAVEDKWPGRRHVLAYEDFRPAEATAAVSANAYVDSVALAAVEPPPPVQLPPPAPVNEHPLTVVSYSWSSPDTKYLHDNLPLVENTPFDGMAVQIGHPRRAQGSVWSNTDRDNLGWKIFQKQKLYDPRYSRDLTAVAVRDLQTTPFTRFRSNYLVTVSYLTEPPTMDWFDDGWWVNIVANTRLVAAAAREGGCEGIMFDPEMYGCALWGWPKLRDEPPYDNRSYEETRAKVRQRGREFGAAVSTGYPGTRLLVLHAWDTSLRYPGTGAELRNAKSDLEEIGYGLLPAFLDGMLEGTDEETLIVDGVMNAYWVDALPDFANKADVIREQGRALSDVPDLFRRKARVGFAIWLDRDHTVLPWDTARSGHNYWSPERLARVLGNALAAGDGFAWVYTETATWLLANPEERIDPAIAQPAGIRYVPDAYRNAVAAGKRRAENLCRARALADELP